MFQVKKDKKQDAKKKDSVQRKQQEKYSAARPNFTGIPDEMKADFENTSGFSFDDVRVHYNSGKPAHLQALAYAQGNQVFLAPGQEQHLRHELGHVVQQKHGIVKPTTVVSGMPVNDDARLEQEADEIGNRRKYGSLSFEAGKNNEVQSTQIVQRVGYQLHDALLKILKAGKINELAKVIPMTREKNSSPDYKQMQKDTQNIAKKITELAETQFITAITSDDDFKMITSAVFSAPKIIRDEDSKIRQLNENPVNHNNVSEIINAFSSNTFYRTVCTDEYGEIEEKGGLVANNTSLLKAVWVAASSDNTRVTHDYMIKFEVKNLCDFLNRRLIELTDDISNYGETSFPNYIIYKSNEPGCIGIGVFLLAEINKLINSIEIYQENNTKSRKRK